MIVSRAGRPIVDQSARRWCGVGSGSRLTHYRGVRWLACNGSVSTLRLVRTGAEIADGQRFVALLSVYREHFRLDPHREVHRLRAGAATATTCWLRKKVKDGAASQQVFSWCPYPVLDKTRIGCHGA